MLKKNVFKISICLVIVLATASFATINIINKSNIQNTGVVNVSTQAAKRIIKTFKPTANDLSSMIDESEFIVIGEYGKFIENWNLARNPNDITKEDTEIRVEGRKFEFKVEKYLKGSGDSNVVISIPYSHEGIVDDTYYEPESGNKVILFLKKNNEFNNYYPSIYPYEFEIAKDKIKFKTNVKYIEDSFKDKELDMAKLSQLIKEHE